MGSRDSQKVLVGIALLATAACSDPLGPDLAEDVRHIQLVTFNILAYSDSESAGIPEWPERKALVIRTLADQGPDVIGLQEAHLDQVETIRLALGPTRWGAHGRGRNGIAAPGTGESVSILYRQDRFELLDQGHFWFSDTPDVPATAFPGLTPARIASWVLLRVKSTGSTFYVYNTHLPSGGSDASKRLRFMTAQLLSQRIDARAHREDPFVVLGDLNATSDEPPIRYLRGETRCDASNAVSISICGMYHADPPPFETRDAFAIAEPASHAGTRCSNLSSNSGPRIDYVMVSMSGAPAYKLDVQPEGTHIVSPGAGGCASDHRAFTARLMLQ